jgi:hypothetical protein
MQSVPAGFVLDQLIVDCAEVALRLELVSRANLTAAASGYEKGCRDYQMLLRRRDGLSIPLEQAGLVQIMLDRICARLKFLERRA